MLKKNLKRHKINIIYLFTQHRSGLKTFKKCFKKKFK